MRPGFPSDWDHASLKHKDFDFAWKREKMRETYEFTSRLPKTAPLTLTLPARTTTLPAVTANGKRVECAFDVTAVGAPLLTVHVPASRANRSARGALSSHFRAALSTSSTSMRVMQRWSTGQFRSMHGLHET